MPSGDLVSLLRASLAAHQPVVVDAPGLRRAAVLAPLVFKGPEPYVLFTERTHDVATHKGQVSFPGGSIDPTDADARQAALRETHEEIGVRPDQIDVLGRLDDVVTSAATFVVTPFVGVMDDGAAHIASRGEVARILEVPLAHLLDPERRHPDANTHHWMYEWQGTAIWGATARMLNQLLHILGLVDPFAEDVAVLRSLTDPDDRASFIQLLLNVHATRESAADFVRRHPAEVPASVRNHVLGLRA